MPAPRIVLTVARQQKIRDAVFANADKRRLQLLHAGRSLSPSDASTAVQSFADIIWADLSKVLEMEEK